MISRGGVEGWGKFGNCSTCRVKLQAWERVLRGGTGNYVGAGVGGNYVFPFKFCEILKQRSDSSREVILSFVLKLHIHLILVHNFSLD